MCLSQGLWSLREQIPWVKVYGQFRRGLETHVLRLGAVASDYSCHPPRSEFCFFLDRYCN